MTRGGREITAEERTFVEHLLASLGSAGDAYRAQLATARVEQACSCGCPSFRFVGEGGDGAYGAPIVDAYSRLPTPHGCGILVFATGARLREVEIYSNSDAGAFGLPNVAEVFLCGEGPGPC